MTVVQELDEPGLESAHVESRDAQRRFNEIRRELESEALPLCCQGWIAQQTHSWAAQQRGR